MGKILCVLNPRALLMSFCLLLMALLGHSFIQLTFIELPPSELFLKGKKNWPSWVVEGMTILGREGKESGEVSRIISPEICVPRYGL